MNPNATVRDSVYIVVSKEGYERAYRTEQFTLKAGEVAFRLDLEFPADVFKPSPVPVVKMTIPREALIREITATAEPRAEEKPADGRAVAPYPVGPGIRA